jgi:hypothetical protein
MLWLQRAHDYARSFSSDDSESHKRAVWDAAYEALRYGARYPVGEGGNALYERNESILAILQFSKDVLNDHYWITDGRIDSLTAYEMAQQFSTFDGTSLDAADFIAPDRGASLDCADMASFISGMATALNIPSRLVSLTDKKAEGQLEEDQEYWHLFAELYGMTEGNNRGWFMIDPGHPQSCGSFSSYTSTEVIVDDFTLQDGNLNRLCFIWGMDYGEWGTSAGIDPTTCWLDVDPNADCYMFYNPNPWGLDPGS